jgi:hypothetical protein
LKLLFFYDKVILNIAGRFSNMPYPALSRKISQSSVFSYAVNVIAVKNQNTLFPKTLRGAPAASIRVFLNDNTPLKGQNINEIILAAIIGPLFHALCSRVLGVINDLVICGAMLLTLCARTLFNANLFLVRRLSAFNEHFALAVAGPDDFIATPEGMRIENKKQTKDRGNEEESGICFHPVFHGVLLFNSI